MLRKHKSRVRKRTGVKSNGSVAKYYNSPADHHQDVSASPFKRKSVKVNYSATLSSRLVDLAIAIVLIGVAALLIIVISPAKVDVSSEIYHSSYEYRDEINKFLKSINYKNKITFDEKKLEKKIIEKFPEVSSVSVRLPLLSPKPSVALEVYEPAIKLVSHNQNIIVDSRGQAVGFDQDFPSLANLINVEDRSGYFVEPGRLVLSAGSISFIQWIELHLKSKKIPVKSLELPDRPQELILRTQDRNYYVKFQLSGDPAAQIGQWLAARQEFDRKKQHPTKYLDVRVPGRVFYQ